MDFFDIALMKKFGGGSGGSGGSGGGGVSSWNDLTDKPFGEDENAVLLPPTQFGYSSSLGVFAVAGNIDIIEGKTYTVNWNGVDYTTVGAPAQFQGMDFTAIGNPVAWGGENNGLPFAAGCLMGGIAAIPLDGSTSVNVGIKGYLLKKIEEKFLPDIGTPLYVTITEEAEGTYTTTTPASEITQAIRSGRPLFAKISAAGLLPNSWTVMPVDTIGLSDESAHAMFRRVDISNSSGKYIIEQRYNVLCNYAGVDVYVDYYERER